jgi:hypothetical protein
VKPDTNGSNVFSKKYRFHRSIFQPVPRGSCTASLDIIDDDDHDRTEHIAEAAWYFELLSVSLLFLAAPSCP